MVSYQLILLTSVLPRLEIATLNRADADLEACRSQVSKDLIALLLKSLTSRGHLSPQAERRMGAAFKQQFLLLDSEIRKEYDRKVLALTAECDLETRKKTEIQYQREVVAMEEAEELLRRASERVRRLSLLLLRDSSFIHPPTCLSILLSSAHPSPHCFILLSTQPPASIHSPTHPASHPSIYPSTHPFI